MSVDKWGNVTGGHEFAAYTDSRKARLVSYMKEIAELFQREFELDCYLAYGTLLGAVRERDFIGHDTDVDLGVWCGETTPDEVNYRMAKVMGRLVDLGYDLSPQGFGQFKVMRKIPGQALIVEVFASWAEEEKFFLYFAVPGAPIRDSVVPLVKTDFRGTEFLAPREPEVLLEVLYGEDWRVPDSGFAYEMTAERWEPFKPMFLRRNADYWNQYYAQRGTSHIWAESPSQFCAFVASELTQPQRVLEFGCGNGRDTFCLARAGHSVVALDYAEEALRLCTERASREDMAIDFKLLNIYDIPRVREFAHAHRGTFDALYARWFLHAIHMGGEEAFLETAAEVLRPRGRMFVEFRTLSDPYTNLGREVGRNERVFGHYRRFVEPEGFMERAREHGFVAEYSIVGRGLAKYGEDDPEVCRATLRAQTPSITPSTPATPSAAARTNGAAAASAGSSDGPIDELTFQCNICGEASTCRLETLERENGSCLYCGSSVRMRAIVHLLSMELFNESLSIAQFPRQPLFGVDFSGAAQLAPLAERIGYVNTFYHREPFLDILNVPDEYTGNCDFVICSEVLEHVAPPVQRAFDNLRMMLKPGAFLVLTVPYHRTGETREHFPELYEYELVAAGAKRILRNRTKQGAEQVFEELRFHGGCGATLEMRLFAQPDLLQNLKRAGFGRVSFFDTNVLERGIFWKYPWSLPLTARAPR